jgi:hypothetical protein
LSSSCAVFISNTQLNFAGLQPGVEYNLDGISAASAILNAFNSLGIIAFA